MSLQPPINLKLRLPVACSSMKSTSLGDLWACLNARTIASCCADATGALTGASEPEELIPVPRIYPSSVSHKLISWKNRRTVA